MVAILNVRPEQFQLFKNYKSSRYLLPSFESIGISAQETFIIDVQDDGFGGCLGFPSGTI